MVLKIVRENDSKGEYLEQFFSCNKVDVCRPADKLLLDLETNTERIPIELQLQLQDKNGEYNKMGVYLMNDSGQTIEVLYNGLGN